MINNITQTQEISSLSDLSLHIPSSSFAVCHSHDPHICLSILFLSVSGQLMAVLFLQMFSPTVWKSQCLYTLSQMSYFYDLDKTRTYGVLNQILWDMGTEHF